MPINPLSYNVQFLSEEDLKSASVINENVDMEMLTPVIQMVQDLYLTKILGTSLLVDLQTKIYNQTQNAAISGSTLTPVLTDDDKVLLNIYITPLMVWLVMQQAPVFLTYKFMNKGVQTQNSDNSSPVTDQQLQLLANRAKTAADWYAQQLINYLLVYNSKYPAYTQNVNFADVFPTSRGYKSSVYLGETANWGRSRGWDGPWGCLDCDWRRYFA